MTPFVDFLYGRINTKRWSFRLVRLFLEDDSFQPFFTLFYWAGNRAAGSIPEHSQYERVRSSLAVASEKRRYSHGGKARKPGNW